VEGRRIEDVVFFITQILNFPHNELSCKNNKVQIIGERKKGLLSVFTLCCDTCNVTHQVYTEPAMEKVSVNDSAALACISIGTGFSQMNEFLGTFNIPPISQRYYLSSHDNLLKILEHTSLTCMEEAGKEEARLAIENGDLTENGIPFITVVADGAWAKRSYRTNYNSNSGIACIVGYRTKKILHLGVRNKFCSLCNSSKKSHTCYKNWSGPSTAMESDIIVEGFKNSLKTHGVVYKFLVADGDSNVYKKILESAPYGHLQVEKVECKNHLLRNFRTKLKEICSKRISSQGKLVPVELRNEAKNNLKRLSVGVESAIKHYVDIDLPEENKLQLLRSDINNSVYHVFGDHKNCAEYFCKAEIAPSIDIITRMEECGLLSDLQSTTNRLKFHSSSLLKNLNNNLAEGFNGILAKFVGGKRVFFSARGGYNLRCYAALVSYNDKNNYYSRIFRNLGSSIGSHTKKHWEKRVKHSTRKRPQKKKKQKAETAEVDQHYGSCAEVPFIENLVHKDDFLQNLKVSPERIHQIFISTTAQRNSQIWHDERRKRLTASLFGKICKLRPTTDKHKVSRSILHSTFLGKRMFIKCDCLI